MLKALYNLIANKLSHHHILMSKIIRNFIFYIFDFDIHKFQHQHVKTCVKSAQLNSTFEIDS